MTEQRVARRYELALPVVIREPAQKQEAGRQGLTRDISTRGVYLVLDQPLAPGSEFDFTLVLPKEITKGTEVFIQAHGKVLRIDHLAEKGSDRIGVAAVIEKYHMVRADPFAT